jgi:hypothetical protein
MTVSASAVDVIISRKGIGVPVVGYHTEIFDLGESLDIGKLGAETSEKIVAALSPIRMRDHLYYVVIPAAARKVPRK